MRRLPGGARWRGRRRYVRQALGAVSQGGADTQRYVDALLDAGGPEQLVWASDWPFVSHEDEITYQRCLDWLEQWLPDAAVRRTVLDDTFVTVRIRCTGGYQESSP